MKTKVDKKKAKAEKKKPAPPPPSSSDSSSGEESPKLATPVKTVEEAVPIEQQEIESTPVIPPNEVPKSKFSKRKAAASSSSDSDSSDDEPAQKKIATPAPVKPQQQVNNTHNNHNNHKFNKSNRKQTFTRISVDPTRQYSTPESRESWGPNVKGKKFRKEKGKKKRCQGTGTGMRIDGSVKSVRLDA